MPVASLDLPAPDLTRQVSVHLLNDPQEWSSFSRLDAKNAGCWESNLMIEGMHCAACALTIEDVLLRVPGVVNAEVSAGSHRARVVWAADAVLPSGWMWAIEEAGYHAVPANDAFSRERRLGESRKALWRLAVAGLCMMQVMMYAYPAYVAAPGDGQAHVLWPLARARAHPWLLAHCGVFYPAACFILRYSWLV